ncbi:rhodanese-like domain-containing protein [Candidatus Aquiluna sp. UB-MaderosW2red]|uniref:rhodanese-like domain-containing protein n=1 Tax=Candidatus Aquiluna sp. UB-MaderosW2red TaxID=1855377 RepID=UPI000875C5EA|nr:rhodanese-like domain-containing protein [Candidatus Aquiluna sp. UB-MaderosW2red]SCX14325.1 Rhodanese-related sulfurtransferase [Candidatus Aquiluna sp. UB-MaderosW2red]
MGLFDFFKKKFETISPAQAKEALDAGAMLIDVREPSEYRSGHASGARLIPLGSLEQKFKDIPIERKILVICQSGMRSRQAAGILASNGYQVTNISGGMMGWKRAGQRVVN